MGTLTATFVALLRGINITGRNRVPMSELRSVAEELGWSGVQTYIQSGNLVFRTAAPAASSEGELERAIERRFALAIPVIVRSATKWSRYVADNPFPEESLVAPNLVMLVLAKRPPEAAAVATLGERATGGERVIRAGDAVWINYPEGFGRSKLVPGVLDRAIGSPVTTRNWRTVLKLQELMAVTGR